MDWSRNKMTVLAVVFLMLSISLAWVTAAKFGNHDDNISLESSTQQQEAVAGNSSNTLPEQPQKSKACEGQPALYKKRQPAVPPTHKYSVYGDLKEVVSESAKEILSRPENYDPEQLIDVLERIKDTVPADDPEWRAILEEIITNYEDPEIKAAAINGLNDLSYADLLIRASEDPAASVREAAVGKMMELESEAGPETFKEPFNYLLINETDSDVLETALEYFDYYSSGPNEFLETASGFLGRSDIAPEDLLTFADLLAGYATEKDAPDLMNVVYSSTAYRNLDTEQQAELYRELDEMFSE